MFPAKMEVDLAVAFPSVCPEELKSGQAFCDHHCEVAEKEGIPTKLDLFIDHCKHKCGTGREVNILLYITFQNA